MIRRPPWWVWTFAAIYILALGFNARQEFYGPANVGWTPQWPSFVVGDIAPRSAADVAGVHKGDLIVAVNGQPILAMPDWFVARAHFESNTPVHLEVRRDGSLLKLQLILRDTPRGRGYWQHRMEAIALYGARLLLLLFGIGLVLCRGNRSAAGALLAIAAVAEGYPSSGWAASLRHLPPFLAIPICLASVSCLLSPIGCLAFLLHLLCLWTPRSWITRGMLTITSVLFLLLLSCSVAMIYAPGLLAKPWPLILTAWPVRFIQDVSGVTPLLFLNVLQLEQPMVQTIVLELWLTVTIACFAGCFALLFFFPRRSSVAAPTRQINLLRSAFLLFAVIVAHNVFVRNWNIWFGPPTPLLFRSSTFIAEAVLLLFVLLLVTYPLVFAPPKRDRLGR